MPRYMNPYEGLSFFEFFIELFSRILQVITGNISFSTLASDEIQLLVLMGISISSGIIGTCLVLKKNTMLANSLSHTILIGIVGAYLITRNNLIEIDKDQGPIPIQTMLIAAIFMGIATTFLTEFLTKKARLQEDASTGLVFSSLFALGIILVTVLTRSAHIGIEVVMGNVDALHIEDLKLVYLVLMINLFLSLLFNKEYKITLFDTGFSKSLGISPNFFNYLIMIQTSITVISAFRAVGVLMILSFLTGPILSARLWVHSFNKLIFLSIFFGCLASLLGVALSRHLLSQYELALSTGGLVIAVLIFIFLLSTLYKLKERLVVFHLSKKEDPEAG